MTIPQNELYPKENQSMLFYLLSGIAKFLQ